ncbi:MAG: HK97 family phage prohead protease [Pseudomonadota bacterium]
MIYENLPTGLEAKFQAFDSENTDTQGLHVQGYASLFDRQDQSGDVVKPGAYATSLAKKKAENIAIKMLWQHDPTQPIGIWDEVYEDKNGLFVKGRILNEIQAGQEALVLLEAGAIDGLSIGYRTVQAHKNSHGGRDLREVELWEVSLVTFPMLPEARVTAGDGDLVADLANVISQARRELLG